MWTRRLVPGQPAGTDKEQVEELSGYQRAIINRNPPLIDEEGYDIESDDDEEQVQEAVASAMEDNPYSSIRIEGRFTIDLKNLGQFLLTSV